MRQMKFFWANETARHEFILGLKRLGVAIGLGIIALAFLCKVLPKPEGTLLRTSCVGVAMLIYEIATLYYKVAKRVF